MFRNIAEAYEVLSNEEKKKKYDLYGFDGPKATTMKYKYADADSIFKSFFSTYGFQSKADTTFFNSFFKNSTNGASYKYSTKEST